MSDKQHTPIEQLVEIMTILRDPQKGCPWDLKQNFASIVPHTIEEAYEVADAIEQQDWTAVQEELGDLLFQVIFFIASWAKSRDCLTLMMSLPGLMKS